MANNDEAVASTEVGDAQQSLAEQQGTNLPRLVSVMRALLAPDGCPWDREQTLESLRPYVIEEAFEVVDAIDSGSPDALREELGDLLLQVVFQAELARAAGWFGPDDVVAAIADKLVRRHPHVFEGERAEDAEQALRSWERRKAKEKQGRGVLDGVPRALPALLRALRVGEKAAAVGYDWPNAQGPRAKVDEELAEFDQACATDDRAAAEHELGDVLLSVANLARKRSLDPEAALRAALERFGGRVQAAERLALERGQPLTELSSEARDEVWEAVKRGVRAQGGPVEAPVGAGRRK